VSIVDGRLVVASVESVGVAKLLTPMREGVAKPTSGVAPHQYWFGLLELFSSLAQPSTTAKANIHDSHSLDPETIDYLTH
jgi:hypothetical protein